jgi:hypothetical protein
MKALTSNLKNLVVYFCAFGQESLMEALIAIKSWRLIGKYTGAIRVYTAKIEKSNIAQLFTDLSVDVVQVSESAIPKTKNDMAFFRYKIFSLEPFADKVFIYSDTDIICTRKFDFEELVRNSASTKVNVYGYGHRSQRGQSQAGFYSTDPKVLRNKALCSGFMLFDQSVEWDQPLFALIGIKKDAISVGLDHAFTESRYQGMNLTTHMFNHFCGHRSPDRWKIMKSAAQSYYRMSLNKPDPNMDQIKITETIKRRQSQFLTETISSPANPQVLPILRTIRHKIGRNLLAKSGNTVMDGPLKGMILPKTPVWMGSVPAMVNGTYEQHVTLFLMENQRFKEAYCFGAGDGYHAVGLIFTDVADKVNAFELRDDCRRNIQDMAVLNCVEHKVSVFEEITPDRLNRVLREAVRGSLFIVDIEGREFDLFDSKIFKNLSTHTIVIELHEKKGSDEVNELKSIADKSHKTFLMFGNESHNLQGASLDSYPDDYRSLCMSEGRPYRMAWLICQPLH